MPEGIVDVIPVDLVSAAIIAVAAKGPDARTRGRPGGVGLAEPAALPAPRRPRAAAGSPSTRSTTPRASPSWCPSGPSPGGAGSQGQLNRAKKTLERAEKVLGALPLRGKQAEWTASIEAKREEAEQALGYVELYGAYAECEAIYGVDRLLALWDAQSPEDQREFCFDPRVIDWDRLRVNVHLPSVVAARPGAHHPRRPHRPDT